MQKCKSESQTTPFHCDAESAFFTPGYPPSLILFERPSKSGKGGGLSAGHFLSIGFQSSVELVLLFLGLSFVPINLSTNKHYSCSGFIRRNKWSNKMRNLMGERLMDSFLIVKYTKDNKSIKKFFDRSNLKLFC